MSQSIYRKVFVRRAGTREVGGYTGFTRRVKTSQSILGDVQIQNGEPVSREDGKIVVIGSGGGIITREEYDEFRH